MSVQITNYQNLADKQRKGYMAVSLDSLVATTAITIKSGSEVEVAGALYEFQADEVESGGTWAGIGNSNVVYVYVVPAGSSATFIYSTTAPTWDTAKQGWYNGTSRAVASLYKDAGALYQAKFLLPSSQALQLPGGARNLIKTSGALGALIVPRDTEYILTAASTATLPAGAQLGCRLTFKNKGNFTTTISAAAGQTIGTTTSTSFALYAQEDYVTLEWDGVSIWYVVATNGPVQSSLQNATTTTTTTGGWTAIGNGLSLGTLLPGVYNLELVVSISEVASSYCGISIGNSTTPISEIVLTQCGTSGTAIPCKITLEGYVLTASATIQGLYYSNNASNSILYSATYSIGRIVARRIG